MRTMRPLVTVLVVAALAGSACSSDDTPNTFCENRAELGSAIEDLGDVNVLDDGNLVIEGRRQVQVNAETQYLFVRGMVGGDTPVIDGERCGVARWHPPASFVVAVSELFKSGQP